MLVHVNQHMMKTRKSLLKLIASTSVLTDYIFSNVVRIMALLLHTSMSWMGCSGSGLREAYLPVFGTRLLLITCMCKQLALCTESDNFFQHNWKLNFINKFTRTSLQWVPQSVSNRGEHLWRIKYAKCQQQSTNTMFKGIPSHCSLQEENQPFHILSPAPGMLQTHENVESLVQWSGPLIFILIQICCSLGEVFSLKLSPHPDIA